MLPQHVWNLQSFVINSLCASVQYSHVFEVSMEIVWQLLDRRSGFIDALCRFWSPESLLFQLSLLFKPQSLRLLLLIVIDSCSRNYLPEASRHHLRLRLKQRSRSDEPSAYGGDSRTRILLLLPFIRLRRLRQCDDRVAMQARRNFHWHPGK